MARSRSRSAPRPAARPAARQQHTQAHRPTQQSPPPPMPHQGAPPPAMPQQGGGGMMSGLGGMVAQGMALGTGSALAHRAVDSVLGSRHPEPQAAAEAARTIAQDPQQPCSDAAKGFADCMGWSNGDMGACQDWFDRMQACRRAAVPQ